MGLFGDKEKISVFSTAAALMQPNENAVADAVLIAILSRESITYSLINVMLTGMGIKADQVRRYAKDHYTLGLSQGGLNTSTVVLLDTDVAAAIAIDLSLPDGVLVNMNFYAPVAFTAIAQIFLINHRGYSVNTKEISVYPSGLTLPERYAGKLLSHRVTVTDIELNQSDHTEGSITYLIESFYYIIGVDINGNPTVVYMTRPTYTYEETFSIPVNIHPGKGYLIASYYELDGGGVPDTTEKFWYYDMDSGKYPDLVPAADLDEENNTMPTVPLRYNNSWVTGNIKTTGTQLLRRMSLDWDDMVDKLDSNPNIAEIDHAYIMFGVDLQGPSNAGCQYLTEFFDYIADLSQYTVYDNATKPLNNEYVPLNTYSFYSRDDYDAGTPESSSYPADNSTVINAQNAYSLIEHGLKLEVSFHQITSCIQAGSIGDVGTATMETDNINAETVQFNHTPVFVLADAPIAIFRHQITATAYKEVKVYGLQHRNAVYQDHAIATSLNNVANDSDEHNFIIPLHYAVTQRLHNFDQNLLFEESLQLIINSYEITTVKWYSRGLFKGIILIIAVIIVIWTGQAWVAGLIAAMEAGIAAIMQMVLMNVLAGLAISQGFKMIAEMVGPELMAAFGVFLAVISLMIAPGSSFSVLSKSMMTADTLVMLSSAAFTAADEAIVNALEDIGSQYEDFILSSEADTEKLEAAQALLTEPDILVYDLLSAQNTAYTSHPMSSEPTKFYNSTIHIGNIGTLALKGVSHYTNLALKLPKPDIYAFGNSPSIV